MSTSSQTTSSSNTNQTNNQTVNNVIDQAPIDTTAPPVAITIDASHPNAHLIAALQQSQLNSPMQMQTMMANIPMPLNAVTSNNPEVMQAAMTQCYQSMMMAQFAAALQMNSQPSTPRAAQTTSQQQSPQALQQQQQQQLHIQQQLQQQLNNQSINQSINQQMATTPSMAMNPMLMAQMSNPAFFPFMFPFTPRVLPSSVIAAPTEVEKGSTDAIDFTKGVVRCICDQFHDSTPMIRCGACNVWQHADCLGITAETMKQDQEYYCELCSPEHPVHIAREILQQNQEREYRRRLKAQLKAAKSAERSSKKRKRSKHSSKSKKDRSSSLLDDANLLAEFDEEMREWHARFKQDIDPDLFSVVSNGEEENDEVHDNTEQSSATSASQDESTETKVNNVDQSESESEDDDDEDDDNDENMNRFIRNLEDVSEADLHAAAAISLLSPATRIPKESFSSPSSKPPGRFGFHFDVSRRSSPSHTRTPSPMLPLPSRHHRSLSSKSPSSGGSTPKSSSNRAALVASLSSSALTNGQSLLPSRSSSRAASPRAVPPLASPRTTA